MFQLSQFFVEGGVWSDVIKKANWNADKSVSKSPQMKLIKNCFPRIFFASTNKTESGKCA